MKFSALFAFILISINIHLIVAEKSKKSFLTKLVQYSRVKRSSQDLMFVFFQGDRRFGINCTKICLRGPKGQYVVNCGRARLFKVCSLCRISFQCGNISQVFV